MGRTAVVRARYQAATPRRAHASSRYLQRFGGELVDEFGNEVTRREVAEAARQHRYQYGIVISPGYDLTPEQWRELAERVMERLPGESFWIHHPDPQHPHLHILCYCDRTLRKHELTTLRELATVEPAPQLESPEPEPEPEPEWEWERD